MLFLRFKIFKIKRDIKKLVEPLCSEKFWIRWYGAYDIDPKHLVFWVCVQSDKMKLELENNSILYNQLRFLLTKHKYPPEAIPHVHIGFESEETVQRVSKGNWYVHFK